MSLWMQAGKLVSGDGSITNCDGCPCTGTGTGTSTGTPDCSSCDYCPNFCQPSRGYSFNISGFSNNNCLSCSGMNATWAVPNISNCQGNRLHSICDGGQLHWQIMLATGSAYGWILELAISIIDSVYTDGAYYRYYGTNMDECWALSNESMVFDRSVLMANACNGIDSLTIGATALA